jgi:hypothetical protein
MLDAPRKDKKMEDHRPAAMFRMTAVVFFAVGAALIGLGAILERALLPVPATVSLHLGIVTVAVVLVDQVWRFCGGQPIDHQIKSLGAQIGRLAKSVDVIESSQNVGLQSVHSRMGSFGSQDAWVALLKTATSQVDLMGRTLLGWTRAAEVPDLIIDKVMNHGVNFRVLVMSPESKCLEALSEEKVNLGPILKSKLAVSLDFFTDIARRLPQSHRNYFQVRCFCDTPSYCALVRVDDRFFVTQYLHSSSSDNSPFFCVHGMEKDWPRVYEREFEQIWAEARLPDSRVEQPANDKHEHTLHANEVPAQTSVALCKINPN